MDVAVTQAGPADRAGLLALLAAQMAEHDIDTDDQRLGAAIDAVLADPSLGVLLAAWSGGIAVGVAYLSYLFSLEHAGRSAWLDELYVTPAYRSRGIGQKLLHAAIAHARSHACVAIDLEVEAAHTRAANLYKREGFHPHQRQRWVLKL